MERKERGRSKGFYGNARQSRKRPLGKRGPFRTFCLSPPHVAQANSPWSRRSWCCVTNNLTKYRYARSIGDRVTAGLRSQDYAYISRQAVGHPFKIEQGAGSQSTGLGRGYQWGVGARGGEGGASRGSQRGGVGGSSGVVWGQEKRGGGRSPEM